MAAASREIQDRCDRWVRSLHGTEWFRDGRPTVRPPAKGWRQQAQGAKPSVPLTCAARVRLGECEPAGCGHESRHGEDSKRGAELWLPTHLRRSELCSVAALAVRAGMAAQRT